MDGAALSSQPGGACSTGWRPACSGTGTEEMNPTGDTPIERPTRFAATVLFVDMVDSTRRAVELGDSEWVDFQAEHDAMLRRTVRRFGGRRLQTLGDGL